ncbi:hypothetical protein ACFY84_35955 [Streptomyces sp. NPDC012438]|uniref:hypothetical protein n=1 Tax=Streptomyces sp. NPDC012438 TaxID=3364833 RepID=UPI0036F127D0
MAAFRGAVLVVLFFVVLFAGRRVVGVVRRVGPAGTGRTAGRAPAAAGAGAG